MTALIDPPVFSCAVCGAKHASPPRDERGAWPFPYAKLTTVQTDKGWKIVCHPCAKSIR